MDEESEDFWEEIETEIKEDIPKVIKEVLSKCGYESRISICNITNEDINEIERFAGASFKQELKRSLKNAPEYSELKITNEAPFKFLPGHRRIILQIGLILADKNANCEKPSEETDLPPESLLGDEERKLKEELCANILKWAKSNVVFWFNVQREKVRFHILNANK